MFEGSRHVRRKIKSGVDGGPSGGSSVHRPGSEDPHRCQRNLLDFPHSMQCIGFYNYFYSMIIIKSNNNIKVQRSTFEERSCIQSKSFTFLLLLALFLKSIFWILMKRYIKIELIKSNKYEDYHNKRKTWVESKHQPPLTPKMNMIKVKSSGLLAL